MPYAGGVVMGFERPDGCSVNNAVQGLPTDHPMLAALLGFTQDLYPIPRRLGPKQRGACRVAAAGSTLARLCQRHGIDAGAAPGTGRGAKVFEAGLPDRLGVTARR